MPRTRNYRDDDSDDAIPIRRHTRKPKKQSVHWAVWLVLGLTGFFGLFLTITIVSCAGCAYSIKESIPKDNATCPRCGHKFYLSESKRDTIYAKTTLIRCDKCEIPSAMAWCYDPK